MADDTTEEKEVEIVSPYTDLDKEEFYKAVLSNKPFLSEYAIFDGAFTIKLRTLTVEEATEVFVQLKKDQQADRLVSDASYLLQLTSYRLALSLVAINDEPFQEKVTKELYKPDGDNDGYIRERAKVFNNWPVFKLSAIAEIFKDFEDKVIALTKEIQTKNFWIAVK